MAISRNEQAFLDDIEAFFAEFAEDITYTPDGGSAKAIKGVVEEEQNLELRGDDGQFNQREVRFLFRVDATAGIASPGLKDRISWDGSSWAFLAQPVKARAGLWSVRGGLVEPEEKSGRNLRIRR